MDIQARGIVKRFGTLVANDGVDINIKPGELHCLLGENGAGKTTLVNVIYGVHEPDGGEILLDGKPVRFKSPKDAIDCGIGMISQHFNLVPRMTVAENIVVGRIPIKKPLGLFADMKAAKEAVLSLMSATGFQTDPDQLVAELAVGQQQRVEILKALYLGAEVLILDEPTAALSPQEIQDLFDVLRSMTSQGKSVLIITHKLDEAMKCDEATVMRKGKVCFRSSMSALKTADDLRRGMFDIAEIDAIEHRAPKDVADTASRETVLSVKDLEVKGRTRSDSVHKISFEVKAGEIYGIAGVAGNGQRPLIDALVGLIKPNHGHILLKGVDITTSSPRNRRDLGVRCVPEDRNGFGVVSEMGVWENVILGFEDERAYSRYKWLDMKAIGSSAAEKIRKFDIKTRDAETKVGTLSGGNVQKVILARELGEGLRLLVAAQPTRGLDFKTAEFVWDLLLAESEAGTGIIVVSYDLTEILALASRIGVMFEGRLREYVRGQVDTETIGWAMTSGWPDGEQQDLCQTKAPSVGE